MIRVEGGEVSFESLRLFGEGKVCGFFTFLVVVNMFRYGKLEKYFEDDESLMKACMHGTTHSLSGRKVNWTHDEDIVL